MSDAPNDPWAVVSQQPLAAPPPPAQADPWAVVSQQPAAPQYTRQAPFVPPQGSTQEQADSFFGLPPGSYVRTPHGLRVVPTPKAEEAAIDPSTGTPVDWSQYEAGDEPGWLGTGAEAAWKGLKSGFTGLSQAPTAFRERPPDAPDTSPTGERIAQGFYSGRQDPKWWIANIMHGAGSSGPAIAGGLAGAVAGLPFGGVGAIPGAVIGAVGGYGLGAAMQSLAPAYQNARAQGLGHDEAVNRAIIESGISGVFNAAAAAAPVVGVTGRNAAGALKRPISEALAQIFGVQPAIGVGEEVAKGAATGDMPSVEDLIKTGVVEAGAGALLETASPAVEAARRRRAQQLAQQPPAPPTAEAAPAAGYAPGDVIDIPLGEGSVGVPVVRVDEDLVWVQAPDGTEVPIRASDLPAKETPATGPETRLEIDETALPAAAAEPPPVPRGTEEAETESGAPVTPPATAGEQEAPAPRPAPESPTANTAEDAGQFLGNAGKGMMDGLYTGLFEALGGADNAVARMETALLARLKPFYDAGLITSPEDIRALVQANYDAVVAGLARSSAETTITRDGKSETTRTYGPAAPKASDADLSSAIDTAMADAFPEEGAAPAPTIEQQVQDFIEGKGPLPEYPGAPEAPPAPAEPSPEKAAENSKIVPENPKIVPETPKSEAPPATNTPVVTDESHTKTGKPLSFVRFPQKPGIDGLGAKARTLGGQWSSYKDNGARPGWRFPTRDKADQFAQWAREQMGEKPAETAPAAPVPQERPRAPVDDWADAIVKAYRESGVDAAVEAHQQILADKKPNHGAAFVLSDKLRKLMTPEEVAAIRRRQAAMRDEAQKPIKRPDAPAGENPTPPDDARSVPRGTAPAPTSQSATDMGHAVVRARRETEAEPTDGQKEAGNYRKGKLSYYGLPFTLESPQGSMRRGTSRTGEAWEVELPTDYGYISRTDGADGDHVDAYLGPDLGSQTAYVIDQRDADTGGFDEHKIMLGFDSWPKARAYYEDAFSDERGGERIGNVTTMSLDQLKTWLKEGDTKNPIGQQALPLDRVKGTPAEKAGISAADLARRFADAFRAGDAFKSITQARKIAEDAGFDISTPLGRKLLDEAIEHAVVLRAREIVAEARLLGLDPKETFDRLVDLYQRQPNLNERTADSVSRQAFSTPAPLAYLASRWAGIDPSKTVYEPTAGNGMLLIEADPQNVLANEIDPTRRAALAQTFPHVRDYDAAKTSGPDRVDVVIANPPFGKVFDDNRERVRWPTGKYLTGEIDHAVALRALKSMADDGSAVLILGSKPEIGAEGAENRKAFYSSRESRGFFKQLYGDYNVVEHITVSGDLYNRQGSAWPVDIIRIEGVGKSELPLPGVQNPRIYESFDELRGLIDARRTVGPAQEQPGTDRSPGPAGGEPRPARVPGSGDRSGAPDDHEGGPGERPAGDQGGDAPGPRLPRPPGGGVGGVSGGGRGTRSGTPRGGDTGAVAPQSERDQRPGEGGTGAGRPGDVADAGRAAGTRPPVTDDALSGALDKALDEAFPQPKTETAPSKRATDDAIESMDDVARGLGELFEERPLYARRELDPGIEGERYDKAWPLFKRGLELQGATADASPTALAGQLVTALRDQHGFDRDKLAAMKPYLMQFLKDVRDGHIVLGPEPATSPEEAVSRRRENTETETNLQVHYTPGSEAEAVGTLVPLNMQSAITRALEALEERVGNIDDFVANKLGFTRETVVGTADKPGVFSAEQVDALALAIDNYERGGAFIIGDQTGVGKGRFVAGMMRYAMMQDKFPVFVTARPGLYADMYRDLRDIGLDPKALMTNSNLRGNERIPINETESLESPTPAKLQGAVNHIIKSGTLPEGYDVLFTTYSQMQFGKEGRRYPRHDALEALAPNAFIVLDESHEAGGTEASKWNAGGEKIPTRADFARDLLRAADGVVYSSATYAKNPHVMSLYFKTDMSLAVDKIEDLTDLITRGGVPLQQVVANMLVESGQYARRERSYDGVSMHMQTVNADMKTAETVSGTLRAIFDIDKEMEELREAYGETLAETGDAAATDNAVGETGAKSVGFSSIMHNVIGQSLLALKAKQAADEAIAAWQRGEKPVIALSNTFGALLNRYIAEQGLGPGSDLSGLTFNRVFTNYLDRTRQVTISDPHGKPERHYITDREMKELGFGDLIADFNKLRRQIEKTDLGDMPGSPIDYLLDRMRAAGMKVGEITGRDMVIEDGTLRHRDPSDAAKKRTMNAFNSGGLDALVINRSGSTGFSLHASEKYHDLDEAGGKIPARQRHMILLQADPNIDTFMQILGRVHRTGQIIVPRYSLLITDLPAEKRPAAVLMRKMAGLNANTSANRESAVSLKNVTDMMNQYGDEVVADLLNDEPRLAATLGINRDKEGGWGNNVAAKFTGRLAIMPLETQATIWDRVERNYKDLIDALDRMGQNTLEAKTLDLDAKTLASEPITEDKGTDSPFAKPAVLEKTSVKRLGRPYTWDEVQARLFRVLGIDDADQLKAREYPIALRRDISARMEEYLGGLRADLEAAQDAYDAIKDQESPEGASATDKRKLEKKQTEIGRRVQALQNAIDNSQGAASRLTGWIDQYRPGHGVTVSFKVDEDTTEIMRGVVLGITPNGKSQNPAAMSAYVAHIAVADGARELKIPLSKIASGQFAWGPTDIADIREAFERGLNVGSREERYIVTGNLLAGFNAFDGRGEIVMFRDTKGEVRQGILMSRGYDAHKALEARPVAMSPDQVGPFLDDMERRGVPMIVQSDGGEMTVQAAHGRYMLRVKPRGGKPFYLNKAVNDILGPIDQFAQRRGAKTWDATAQDAGQLGKILKVYADNGIASFQVTTSRDLAREFLEGQKPKAGLAEEGGAAGGTYRDMAEDFARYAERHENMNEAARDWTQTRGGRTGFEYMAALTPDGEAVAAYTDSNKAAVSFTPELMRALDDPSAAVVVHHNHPSGNSLGRMDLMQLALPGLDTVIAHGHDNSTFIARLTPEMAVLDPLMRKAALIDAHEAADKAVRARFEQQIKAGRLSYEEASINHFDVINRALDAAGVIEYVSSRQVTAFPEFWAKGLIRDAAMKARRAVDAGIGMISQEEFDARIHRSTLAVRPEESLGRLPGGSRATAGPGRPGREAGAGERGEGVGGPKGLAEDRPGYRNLDELIARGREAAAARTQTGGGGKGGGPPKPPGGASGSASMPPPPRGHNGGPPLVEEKAALNRIMHTDERGLLERLKGYLADLREDAGTRFKQGFLDDLAGLEAALKRAGGAAWNAYKSLPLITARLTRNHDSVMAAVVGLRKGGGFVGGAIRWNEKEGAFEIASGSKPFAAIFKPVFDAGLQDAWALWAIVNRAKRLMAEGREHNVSAADIDRWENLDQQHLLPNGTNLFRQTMTEWRALNKATLDLAEATGLINAEQRATWENDDYVPFFRALDDDKIVAPTRGKRGVANQRPGIHRLEGGEDKVANLYENMVRNLSSIIDRSMKNQAMREIVGELSGTEALTPLSKLARQELDTPEAQARLVAMGLDPDEMTEAAKEAAASLYGARKRGDPDLVSVMDGGKIQYYRVEDPLLLRSLVSLGPQVDVAMPILRLAKNVLTSAVTIDPGFMLRNLLRDTVHSKVVTPSKFTPGIDTAKGFVKSLTNDPSAVALMAGGAGGGHFYSTAPEKVRRSLERKDFKDSVLDSPLKLWRALEHIGRASEQANRIAVYERAIADGATKAEALAQAQDLLNYSMRGDFKAMRFLIETVPFLNARIQGLYRLYRGARDNPKSFLLRGGMLMGAAIALWAANQDDERYKALEDWEKQNYFNFFVGGQHFRLPMPFEVGVIFAVIPEMLLNYAKGGRGRELAKAFGSTVMHQLSLNPTPQLVRPLYDLYANKAAFTGKPIISQSEERLIAPEQHGPGTSQMMVELGHAIGVSPDWAQYLVTGYGGTVAAYLLAAADASAAAVGATNQRASKRLDQMPIVSSFVREEPALSTRWLTEFYDLKTEVDQLYATLKKYQRVGDARAAQQLVASDSKKIALHKPMGDLGKKLGLIRSGMEAVEANRKMPPAEKRRQLDALLKQRNEAVKAVRPMIREVDGLRATP